MGWTHLCIGLCSCQVLPWLKWWYQICAVGEEGVGRRGQLVVIGLQWGGASFNLYMFKLRSHPLLPPLSSPSIPPFSSPLPSSPHSLLPHLTSCTTWPDPRQCTPWRDPWYRGWSCWPVLLPWGTRVVWGPGESGDCPKASIHKQCYVALERLLQ